MLLQLGEAMDPIRDAHGGYRDWFEAAWGGPLTVVDGRPGGPHPDPRAFAGLIVSGSPASLCEPAAWMDDACALVIRAKDAGTPVLGVCFGHQLIGRASGGRVIENPAGWEMGTHEVRLHPRGQDDWLLAGLPARARVNLTHRDAICPDTRPGHLEVLAESDQTAIQAVAWGEHVRGVQFHPEITGAVAKAYIHHRRHLLRAQADDLHARTTDAPDGVQVLANFRRFVARAA
jgi:GMP synthase (glutamine-hydrolysing)